MMCDLSSSQSKHGLNHFCMAKLIFLGVAADLRCYFYIIKRNFFKGLQSEFHMLIEESKLGLCDELHPW